MKIEEFESSLDSGAPPAELTPYLKALWHEKSGNWSLAHEIVQDIEDDQAAWVHAYLHRREGDDSNARYWYSHARKTFPAGRSLDQEWRDLVEELLVRSSD